MPYIATWEITRRCNLNCIHCYNNSSPYGYYGLRTKDCYKIIDNLEDSGITTLIITGGEPILRKDIEDISFYARNKFKELILQTNGKDIKTVSDKFLNIFDEIEISIYGDATIDKIVKRTNYTGLPESFEKIKKAEAKFSISTVLMSLNKNQMEFLAELGMNADAIGMRIQDFIPVGRGTLDLYVSPKESERIKNLVKKKYGNFVTISSDYECGGGEKFIEIDLRGNVSPCAFINSNENILEKSLYEMVNNSPIFKQFEKARNMTKTKTKCQILARIKTTRNEEFELV